MGSWLGVMVNNFRPLGISDQQIGMMGLFSVLSQCFFSIVLGFFTDRYASILVVLIIFKVYSIG